jgi:SH3-like domain-containing protein
MSVKRLFGISAAISLAFAVSAGALEPEFRSIKTKTANVRVDSHKKAKAAWKMWKYFVVEILKYRGDWRLVKDFEGDQGWVHKSVLSPTPCVQVKGKMANLRKGPGGKVLWELEHGYALRVFSRKGDWLEVSDLEDANGWVHASTVWGMMDPEPAR